MLAGVAGTPKVLTRERASTSTSEIVLRPIEEPSSARGDGNECRPLANAEELVEYYDPTDVFGDLADALAEAFPAVAPELAAEEGESEAEDADEAEDRADETRAEDEDDDAGGADEPDADADRSGTGDAGRA